MRIEDYIGSINTSKVFVRIYDEKGILMSEKLYDGLCDIHFVSSV